MKTFLSRLSKKEDGAGAIEAMVLLAMAILVLIFLNSMWEWIKSPYSARMVDLGETINGIGKTKPMGSSPTLSPSTPGNQPGAPVQIPLDPPSVKPGGPGSQQPPEGPPTQIVPAIPLPLPDPMAPGHTEQPKPTAPNEFPPIMPQKSIEEKLAELHPDRMSSIDDRVIAYQVFSDLFAEKGNQSKFAKAASIVSDQISGGYQNTFYFGPETEEHLRFVNDKLYRFNYPILCELVRNPNIFPDPFRFLPGSVTVPTSFDGAPYDSISFDRRMVRAEQAMVSRLNERLQGNTRQIVMDELDESFSPATMVGLPKDPVAFILYGNPTASWVREALNGRPIMFSHEPTRVALGHAMIYYLHGLNERQFLEYKIKDPTFPKYPRPIPTPIPSPTPQVPTNNIMEPNYDPVPVPAPSPFLPAGFKQNNLYGKNQNPVTKR